MKRQRQILGTFVRLKVLFALGVLFVSFVAAYAAMAETDVANGRKVASSEVRMLPRRSASKPAVLGAVTPAITAPTTEQLNIYQPQHPPVPANPSPTATVVRKVATKEPVIFITIDDGVIPNQKALELMRQRKAVATLFLNNANIHRHYDYFKQWLAVGSSIQNHTDSHPHMPMLTPEQQKMQICKNVDEFQQVFGTHASLYRPPYGEYDETTKRIVPTCSGKYIVMWSVEIRDLTYIARPGHQHFEPGDIILLHFTENLDKELAQVFAEADSQHLQIGRLEDWLK